MSVSDEEARRELLERHLGWVKKLAWKFCDITGRWELLDDFVGEGAEALVRGYKRFDGSLQIQFETFMFPRILGAMKDYLRRERWGGMTKTPRRSFELATTVMKTHDELMAKYGRKPTVEEIARGMNRTCEEVDRALEAICIGFEPFDGASETDADEEVPRREFAGHELSAGKKLHGNDIKEMIDDALGQIAPNCREVIELRIYGDMSFKEIGVKLGRSENAAKLRHKRGLDALTKLLERLADWEEF
jgi:RNA polymerase sigma factor (sigma-70 family)